MMSKITTTKISKSPVLPRTRWNPHCYVTKTSFHKWKPSNFHPFLPAAPAVRSLARRPKPASNKRLSLTRSVRRVVLVPKPPSFEPAMIIVVRHRRVIQRCQKAIVWKVCQKIGLRIAGDHVMQTTTQESKLLTPITTTTIAVLQAKRAVVWVILATLIEDLQL